MSATFSEGEIIDYFLQHHRKPGQKSRSHADLRLGRPGEPLDSWAIPKERLPGAGERLLAPETTPHDYSYGRFSGKFGKGRNASEVELIESGQASIDSAKDGVMTFSIQGGDKPRKFALVRMKNGKKWIIVGSKEPKQPLKLAKEAKERDAAGKTALVPMRIVSADCGTKAALRAEIADTPVTRRKGLSKRASLNDNTGMFFNVPGPFWMRGVNMPLDILFMSKSGTVLDVQTMKAEDADVTSAGCNDKRAATSADVGLALYRSRKPGTSYALELPAGWARKQNVVEGDRLEVD